LQNKKVIKNSNKLTFKEGVKMDNNKGLQLREHDVIPTSDVLEKILEDSFAVYETFQEALSDLEMEQNWQWYTPHKSWYAKGQYFWTSSRGTRKEKTLYWLYVYEGYFNVAIWFKEKNRIDVLNADVNEKTKKTIRDAKTEMGLPTFPVTFKVTTKEALADIYTLIDCKKRIEC